MGCKRGILGLGEPTWGRTASNLCRFIIWALGSCITMQCHWLVLRSYFQLFSTVNTLWVATLLEARLVAESRRLHRRSRNQTQSGDARHSFLAVE